MGISQHGRVILFNDIYRGSISDSKLTGECSAVCFVENHHEIMGDCDSQYKNFVL